MLESEGEAKEKGSDGRGLGSFMYATEKGVVEVETVRMECADGEDEGRDPSCAPRTWYGNYGRILTHVTSCAADLGDEMFVRTWRERPRNACDIYLCVWRNILTLLLIFASGVITWESSVHALRTRADKTAVFPLYLPQAVALSLASVWKASIAPGNLVGIYLGRLYMIWRGGGGFTSLNTTIMLLAALLGMMEAQTGGYYLRKFLCHGGTKRVPTIDTVVEATWYLVIVFFTSLIFCTVIALCIVVSPLVSWSDFWRYWATWWLGDLAAMITISPTITHLIAWECPPSLRRPMKIVECIVLGLVTVGIMVIVFLLNVQLFVKPLPYLCFPLFIFAGFRFNRVGCAFIVSAIAYSCSWGSIRMRGAIYNMSQSPPQASSELILQIELFSSIMGVVGITLAAAVREKKRLTQKLHQMNLELEKKVDQRTSDLRIANADLQISQRKAEQASHAKSDFLANMSHEIRTPIHGILGLTALLLESELTTDQKESLVSVKECADLLLHIINSVLDLAKIEAGRLEVEQVPFNIRKMVSSTFRMMQTRAQDRGLQLLLEVDRGVPQTLVGDVGKLQQCLLNLVGNALKFTHEGSITVRVAVANNQQNVLTEHTKPLNVDDCSTNKSASLPCNTCSNSLPVLNVNVNHPQGCFCSCSTVVIMDDPEFVNKGSAIYSDHLIAEIPEPPESILVEFEVRDTGIGISKEKLQDMFNPFTQADASTSRLYGGTGLGLCIVQRFVELLGGTIWAGSEVGNGSSFHICLPFFLTSPKASPAEMSPRVAPAVTSLEGLKMKILFKDRPMRTRRLQLLSCTSLTLENYAQDLYRIPAGKCHPQSWSLMGGLSFKKSVSNLPSETSHDDSGQQNFTSPLKTKVRSANDLVGMWKGADNKVTPMDDIALYTDERSSSMNDLTPSKEGSGRGSSRGRVQKLSPFNVEIDRPCVRLQGPTLTGEACTELDNMGEALPNQESVKSSHKWVAVPPDQEPNVSDRGATSDVTDYVSERLPTSSTATEMGSDPWELVQLRSIMLASSDTSRTPDRNLRLATIRPQGDPTDSNCQGWGSRHPGGVENERGYVTSLASGTEGLVPARGLTHPIEPQPLQREASELSRESSIELDKLLENKANLKILLAEDNAINQKVASRQLEKHGHVVTVVGDGQQALDVVLGKHGYFDLVLMDVQMPNLDGLQATELIRRAERENGWGRLPVLGLTAHAIQGYQETCLKHGMDGYLGKPFDIKQLLKTIGHILPTDKLASCDPP